MCGHYGSQMSNLCMIPQALGFLFYVFLFFKDRVSKLANKLCSKLGRPSRELQRSTSDHFLKIGNTGTYDQSEKMSHSSSPSDVL